MRLSREYLVLGFRARGVGNSDQSLFQFTLTLAVHGLKPAHRKFLTTGAHNHGWKQGSQEQEAELLVVHLTPRRDS